MYLVFFWGVNLLDGGLLVPIWLILFALPHLVAGVLLTFFRKYYNNRTTDFLVYVLQLFGLYVTFIAILAIGKWWGFLDLILPRL